MNAKCSQMSEVDEMRILASSVNVSTGFKDRDFR